MQKSLQQQLCEKIYEILPNKKELEFGCEVIYHHNDGQQNENEKSFVIWASNSNSSNKKITLQNIGDIDADDENLEIIGQKLGLVDLLLAMKKAGYPMEHYYMQEILGINPFEKSKKKYNLQDDNILNQSDELCEFCLGVLDNK